MIARLLLLLPFCFSAADAFGQTAKELVGSLTLIPGNGPHDLVRLAGERQEGSRVSFSRSPVHGAPGFAPLQPGYRFGVGTPIWSNVVAVTHQSYHALKSL